MVLVNKSVEFQIKIPNGCWENREKLLGSTFLPHPVELAVILTSCRP